MKRHTQFATTLQSKRVPEEKGKMRKIGRGPSGDGVKAQGVACMG